MIPFKLFEEVHIGPLTLRNRVVMAPLTRCRAIGHIPTEAMVNYYQQRAKAGLIITEGTAPTEDGLGYARIPGIYNWEQLINWRKVTNAVHDEGGKIFVQLMHCGRIAHPLNMPKDAVIMAPSAIQASGEIWTDQQQLQPFTLPKESVKKRPASACRLSV
jgi:N-ethylmaleimide reductase